MTKINNKTYFKVPITWVLFFPSLIFKDKCSALKSSAVMPAFHDSQFMEQLKLSMSASCLGSMMSIFPHDYINFVMGKY